MSYAIQNGTNYIWLLNNDTVVETDTLGNLVDIGEGSPEIGIISPVIYYYDKPHKIQFCGSYADWTNHKIIYPNENTIYVDDDFKYGENVCLWGTALLIKIDVVRKVGYLNNKFYAYWEDTEYSIRSIKAGFRNELALNAKIYHKTPIKRKPYYYYFMARNEYFTWFQYLNSTEKVSFMRKYLARKIAEYGSLKESVRFPLIIKRRFSWHPYLWVNLFKGDLLNIIFEISKRVRAKFVRGHLNNK